MLTDLLLAVSFDSLIWWIDVIVKVAVALGAVVFVHELGHFLMAKACGVKVEKFMIGFDIGGYKLSRRWGETLYGIGILPLGGYVKMFGQDDDPSHIAEQMQKSQIDAASLDAVPITGPNGETYYVDRRSYLAKSVPQRMAIISAGVIMNVIFAFIFAVIAYGMGVKYLPCIVTETMPGSPAWKLGLEPGDEIVRLGDRVDPTFLQLRGGVTLADLESGIPCQIRRAADGKTVPMTLTPTQEAGELATVGVGVAQSLELRDTEPVDEDSVAASARLVSPAEDSIKKDEAKFRGGDTVASVNSVPVENFRQYVAELAKSADKPLEIGVRRPLKDADGNVVMGPDGKAEKTELLTFEVQPQPLCEFGLVMEMGPITAVQNDSPADKAEMKKGDLITQVDGKPIALVGESLRDSQGASAAADAATWIDPLTLPEYLQRAAREGREVEFKVLRKASGETDREELSFRIKPVVPIAIHSETPIGAPVAADAVGIAYRIENVVQAVAPSGPAASTEIAAGDRVIGARIIFPVDKKGKTPDPPVDVELGPNHPNWPWLVDAVQFKPQGTRVELRFLRGESKEPRTVQLEPQPADRIFIARRGLVFEPIFRVRKAATFSQAVRYGWEETIESLTMVFRFLQKLGRQVPFKMLGGPGTIAVAAGDAASQGLSSLLIFLTMLSANLAVINFLPIPLLDGGHMVFLAYEGIRGRPANERFVLAMHMAGFVFIISLMLFVIGLDIQRWIL
ncbi:MAG: site-2 protease family protein [Planctomycetes bacterium]|nr:site-2 protease family protein [Planctomycetota bacterium]